MLPSLRHQVQIDPSRFCCVDYDTHETVLAYRIMRGSHLKRHLVIGAKIDRLDVAPGAKIPEVDMMTILI